jgi:PhnB protein
MRMHPYLSFSGNCEAAFKFYEKALNGKIVFLATYGGSPMENQVPPEWKGKVMHATFTCGDQVLGGADVYGDQYRETHGIAITLETPDPAEAERVFSEISQGATVRMPLQETFWAHRFGMLRDQFGIPWMMNCEKGAAGQ